MNVSKDERTPTPDKSSLTDADPAALIDRSHTEPASQLEERVRQQKAVADLGQLALSINDLDALMDQAVESLRDVLRVDFTTILAVLPDQSSLIVRAAAGWDVPIVGSVHVPMQRESQSGYTLLTSQPVIVEDIRTETRFAVPQVFWDHGVVSGISVIIPGDSEPYGVLKAHTRQHYSFTPDDIHVLQSIANIVALSVRQHRDREELQLRQRTMTALVENTPDIVARYDRECRHIYINRSVEAITGMDVSAFIGKRPQDVGLTAQEAERIETAIREVFRTGQQHTIDFTYSNGNRDLRLQSRIVPEYDTTSEITSVLSTTRDVTSQKVAEEHLKQSEERFRSLSSSSPVGVFIAGTNGSLTYVNPRFLSICNVSEHEALDGNWINLVDPEERLQLVRQAREAFAHRQELLAEIRLNNASSYPLWVRLRASPMFDDAGGVSGYVGTIENISEQKAFEQRLSVLADAGGVISSSLDVIQTAQTLADVFVPVLADWCFVHLFGDDGALSDVVVAHDGSPEKRKFAERYRRDIPSFQHPHPMARAVETGEPQVITVISEADWRRIAITDAHYDLIREFQPRSAIVVPMYARDRALGVLSLIYSDSGRQFTEADLSLALDLGRRGALAVDNARLYRASQDAIREREQFLSIASHELKTPLTSVKGYTQMLERFTTGPELDTDRIKRVAARVEGQVERLEALIADLLDVSRIQQGRLDLRLNHLNLTELGGTVLTRFDDAPERTPEHQLILETQEPIYGYWDAERLDQVITNLLSNALKYSPDGGEVRLSITELCDEVEMVVSDEGIGIRRADQRQLFQPFHRPGRNWQKISGTGLGLFIVRQIVEQHSGEVWVESEPGRGSRFIVRLPRDSSQPRFANQTVAGS